MVKVNPKLCIGCGACVAICDSVFELKAGKSVVKKGQEKSNDPCVQEAIEGCPVGAISK
jgi:ferredoxin